MTMAQAASAKEWKMREELAALSPAEKEKLIKDAADKQRGHARTIMAMKDPKERANYLLSIPEKDQVEMAKLQLLTVRANDAVGGWHSGHGHSHAHRQLWGSHGHNHTHGEAVGGHNHGHQHGEHDAHSDTGTMSHHGHNRSHQHGEHYSHDHHHSHKKHA
ncbi:unnamed protein product [Discosporangium mesarthrocarpum]